jgi:serine/threonine protein kinase
VILPSVAASDVVRLLPHCANVGSPLNGGQKLVFPCTIDGSRCAAKFILVDTVRDLPADPAEDDEQLLAANTNYGRLQREVQALCDCPSPYVVRLGPVGLRHATIRDQIVAFFTEEWIPGECLIGLLGQNRRLSASKVALIGCDISRAIEALSNGGYVHRDVKPANIVSRSPDGTCVLLDMGLVLDSVGPSLSAPGQLVGTPAYFSPEQADWTRRRELDFRSDLYSLGVVMFEALAGRHPLAPVSPDWRDTLRRVVTEPPPQLSGLCPDAPQQLVSTIMRTLSKQPHKRYSKIEEFRQDLYQFANRSA